VEIKTAQCAGVSQFKKFLSYSPYSLLDLGHKVEKMIDWLNARGQNAIEEAFCVSILKSLT